MTTIKLKNGSGAPTSGDLAQGEPALDLTNKRLYTEDSGGTVIEVGTNPTSITTGAITSTGVDVTGTVTSDGLRVDGTPVRFVSTAPMLNFMESGVTDSNHRLRQNAGNFVIQKLSDDEGTATDRIAIDGGTGDISLYSGVVQVGPSGSTGDRELRFETGSGSASGEDAIINSYRSNADLILKTNDTERMRVDSSGNVGIGTISPQAELHVSNGSAGFEFKPDGISDGNSYMQVYDRVANSYDTLRYYAAEHYFHINNDEKVRIDSSGNVGIGTSSPSSFTYLSTSPHLVIGEGSSDPGVTFYSSTTGYGRLAFADGTDSTEQYRGLIQYYHADNSMQFYTGSDERMRIDSSGNLLVGTTDTTPHDNSSGNGIVLGDGLLSVAQSGGNAAIFNRMTSDGSIVQFRKDGTPVGSIGTKNGDLVAGTGVTGIGFFDSSDAILPYSITGSAYTTGETDLGINSNRFKDLYLSGGVVFGTTGGNVTGATLDDYEEGTWTPVWSPESGTIVTNTSFSGGSYTKIGNIVHVHARLYTNNVTSPAGEITISGLPFAVENNTENRGMQLFSLLGITGTLSGVPVIYFKENTSTAIVLDKVWDSTEISGDIANHFDNDTWGYFYGVYRTA